jgi:N6-L-threonylcarbamoyladenine synthase
LEELTNERRASIARAFQKAAFGQIEEKLVLALEQCKNEGFAVTSVVVSGGVASNHVLRQQLDDCLLGVNPDLRMIFPPPELCTDNAAMIAWVSMYRFLGHDHDDYTIDLQPKWSLERLTNA